MKSVPKLIKRFVGILMLSSFLILVINFTVLVIITATQAPNGSPWTTAEQAAESMEKSEQGYKMSDEMIEGLNAQNVWAVYIDNKTGECVWHSDNLPDTVLWNIQLPILLIPLVDILTDTQPLQAKAKMD